MKRQHGDASSRTCPHCAKVFSLAGSLPRHVKRCTQRPENLLVCSVPASSVPVSPSDSRSKAKVGKRSLPAVEDYIPLLRAYLLGGKFIYSFATKRSSLAPTTVTSYCSFVRKYLEAIHRGLTPRGQHPSSAPSTEIMETITVRVLLLTSIRLQHISTFISSLRDDEFKARTAVNYMSAISWHLTYLKFLTHPDLDTSSWAPSLQELRVIFCPELANEKRVLERQLTESHQYLHQQISTMSDEATQQTKARNSGEALQLRGRWVKFKWMMTMACAINEEGWGRMRCLQAMLAAGETHEVLCLRP